MSEPQVNSMVAPASPCVRNCCLDSQDICLGCHRSLAEILAWGEASPARKRAILERCAVRHGQHLLRVSQLRGGSIRPD